MESACYHQLRCYSKLALVNSSFWRSANNTFAWSYIGSRHPAYLRGGVPGHLGSLRVENVIAMSWLRGLWLRLETADVDYRSGCRG
jgi:hypothetical protein